jgi:hypothetical protein
VDPFSFSKQVGVALLIKLDSIKRKRRIRMKMKEFLLLLVNKILNSVIVRGLFCGFMTTATVGLGYGYFFVVASVFIKDNRRRVGVVAAFGTAQFVMFASVYNRPLHEGLVQPHRIKMFLFFLSFFLLQLLWTSLTTLRN